jgi:hypothetical protein
MLEEWASIGIKKSLPITKFLNYEMNKLRGSGVLQNTLAHHKQSCPLDENLILITFSKMVSLFSVFVLGGILSIIIFIFESAVSRQKDGTLENIDGNQCNVIKGRIPTTNEIGVQCNIGQSVAIGTKNIVMIH